VKTVAGRALVLGIESSCDDTGAAVVADGCTMLSNVVASSAGRQAEYGGVVPEVAAREHVVTILPTVDRALAEAGVGLSDLAAVAVTQGPGVFGALLVGLTAAKALAVAARLPLVGVNHLEAHLYANALVAPLRFPALALVVSGGHTSLYLWQGHGRIRLLGETLDDAAGEAFDKGARLLGLSYPGGPEVERLAEQGTPDRFRLPVARLGEAHPYDFSFSGVKTAARALVERHPDALADIAWALQQAIVEALVEVTVRAALAHGLEQVYLAGGVSANRALRAALAAAGQRHGFRVAYPPPRLCTDNGAMVAALGYYRWRAGERLPLSAPVGVAPLGTGEHGGG
jgi:N6-L-threonylcarbamoyladenine synthase